MSRNMISINTKAFDNIKKSVGNYSPEYFSDFKDKIYIETNEIEKDLLCNAEINKYCNFYNKLLYIEIIHKDDTYVVTRGLNEFDIGEDDISKYEFSEACAGILTLLLAEEFVSPIEDERLLFELYDNFLADNEETEPRAIPHKSLSEFIQPFSTYKLKSDSLDSERLFGCLLIKSHQNHINNNIEIDMIKSIFENGSSILPYEKIIKSILYYDEPKQLFLEIYRCIEYLYCLPATLKLRKTLNKHINNGLNDWELSEALETSLGWRQSEEAGLVSLISKLDSSVLTTALSYLKKTNLSIGIQDIEKDEVEHNKIADNERKAKKVEELKLKKANFIAKRIYKCRNYFVHFRAIHSTPYIDDDDIPHICNLIIHLLDPIYSSLNVGPNLIASSK